MRAGYRIIDTGAVGAIVVSRLGLQEGAKRIAAAENIFEVLRDQDSTPDHFVMHFLGKVRAGAAMPLVMPAVAPAEPGSEGK